MDETTTHPPRISHRTPKARYCHAGIARATRGGAPAGPSPYGGAFLPDAHQQQGYRSRSALFGMSYSVVVRGPLGIGKSTVSTALARAIGAEHISIDKVLEEHRLEEWDADRISLKSFLRANGIAGDRALRALAAGQPVIFDGCFYWREQLDDLARRLAGGLHVFTLKAPLKVCIERDKTRPLPQGGEGPLGGDQQGEPAARAVYGLVAAVEYGQPIDATGPVDVTVSEILQQLRAPSRRR